MGKEDSWKPRGLATARIQTEAERSTDDDAEEVRPKRIIRGVMINEAKLRQTLIILADSVKKQHDALWAAMDEILALRQTVRGLDPTFDDVFRQRKADLSSAEFRAEMSKLYDDLIHILKSGDVC